MKAGQEWGRSTFVVTPAEPVVTTWRPTRSWMLPRVAPALGRELIDEVRRQRAAGRAVQLRLNPETGELRVSVGEAPRPAPSQPTGAPAPAGGLTDFLGADEAGAVAEEHGGA